MGKSVTRVAVSWPLGGIWWTGLCVAHNPQSSPHSLCVPLLYCAWQSESASTALHIERKNAFEQTHWYPRISSSQDSEINRKRIWNCGEGRRRDCGWINSPRRYCDLPLDKPARPIIRLLFGFTNSTNPQIVRRKCWPTKRSTNPSLVIIFTMFQNLLN